MTLGIATNSIEKINGIKIAFSRFFGIPEIEIRLLHKSVESGVPEQPFNEEIYSGAKNRVNSLIASENTDFYISCEAGIEEFMGNFFNVQVVCIFEKKTQKYVFGKSAGWQIPSKDIEIIKKSNLDSYLRGKGVTCIQEVLGSEYSRANVIAQATEHALAASKMHHIL